MTLSMPFTEPINPPKTNSNLVAPSLVNSFALCKPDSKPSMVSLVLVTVFSRALMALPKESPAWARETPAPTPAVLSFSVTSTRVFLNCSISFAESPLIASKNFSIIFLRASSLMRLIRSVKLSKASISLTLRSLNKGSSALPIALEIESAKSVSKRFN